MPNYELGGKKYKGNAQEPILKDGEWGYISIYVEHLGCIPDIASEDP